jgi:hypothetical protein
VLNRSFHLAAGLLLAVLWWGGISPQPVAAQGSPGTDALRSEVYFGLRTADGKVVDAQAWEKFVTGVVVPRFPEGLTVIEASGHSNGPGNLNPTRILVVVHPNSDEAQNRLREIKAEYRKRFAGIGLFHTDQPIRVHRGD